MSQAKQTHPRINCLVAGCKRGTTRFAPQDDGSASEFICGLHWRTVPKAWRLRLSLYARRYRAAERKGDLLGCSVAARVWWRRWGRITRLLRNPDSLINSGLPATIAEQLRQVGFV